MRVHTYQRRLCVSAFICVVKWAALLNEFSQSCVIKPVLTVFVRCPTCCPWEVARRKHAESSSPWTLMDCRWFQRAYDTALYHKLEEPSAPGPRFVNGVVHPASLFRVTAVLPCRLKFSPTILSVIPLWGFNSLLLGARPRILRFRWGEGGALRGL